MELSDEQTRAVELYTDETLLLINGPPGSGKTTLIRHLVDADKETETIIGTPTGCAAERAKNHTGVEAFTLDKLFNSGELLQTTEHKNFIVDEASMLSAEQLLMIRTSLPNLKRLCIIGDECQLPCVAGMPVFSTLLRVPGYPKVFLTRNHRQLNKDCALVRTLQNLHTATKTLDTGDDSLVVNYFPTNNLAIQAAARYYTKGKQMLALSKDVARQLNESTAHSGNNRVICCQNLYEKGSTIPLVSNGVMGTQVAEAKVEYDNGFVDRKRKERGFKTKFDCARAVTVHRIQGNEFAEEGVVVITGWKGPVPLELINTALSRFKTKVTIFTTRASIANALAGEFGTHADAELAGEFEIRQAKRVKL